MIRVLRLRCEFCEFAALLRILLLAIPIFLSGCSAHPTAPPASTVVPIASPRPAASPTIFVPTPIPTPTLLSIEPRSISGDLLNQIERLEAEMPRAGSEGFIIPTNEEKESFTELVAKIQNGELPRAGGIAAEFGYELMQYTDRGDGNSGSWLLRELKPIRKGWGLYAFRSSGARDIIIEAPHPLSDEGTPSIAAQAYRLLQARAVLIAGAHRDANVDRSSDVAHHIQSIFEAVHATITKTNSTIVLQIHGFAASKHPGYPQMVLSSDQAQGSALLDRLAAAFKAHGVKTGTCGAGQWADLCGETNVQSRSSGPAIFIHIELDESMRLDSAVVLKVLKQMLTN